MNNNVECIKYLLQENCQKFPFNEDCRERGGTTTRTEWVKINSESAFLFWLGLILMTICFNKLIQHGLQSFLTESLLKDSLESHQEFYI